MRPGLFVLAAALILAIVAGQNTLLRSTEAETTTPAISACAPAGDSLAAVQGGGCSQPSLDSAPAVILSHTVFPGACPDAKLHVMRYVPAGDAGAAPLVATWCA